nr:hypothetical protein [Tanacetum cinerariifolium]
GTIVPTIEQNSLNSTNTFSAAGPLNIVASLTYGKSSFIDASQLLDDLNMPKLEDITYFDDEDVVGVEADFNNLETSITVKKAGEEVDQQYALFPVWSFGSINPQNNDRDVSFDGKEHDFDAKNPDNEVNAAGTIVPTIEQNSLNSTNTFSAAGPLNIAASLTYGKSSFIDASQLLDDLNMPKLEDITYFDDEDVVGVEADFNNLETSITEEPKRVHQALKDPSYIEAMHEEPV